jgi:hypothetical protein
MSFVMYGPVLSVGSFTVSLMPLISMFSVKFAWLALARTPAARLEFKVGVDASDHPFRPGPHRTGTGFALVSSRKEWIGTSRRRHLSVLRTPDLSAAVKS